jgi:hypothetical protein
MKRAHIWLGLCLLLALAALTHDSVAQVAPENGLMAGAGIEKPADEFMEALQKSDLAGMHGQLALWKQNAAKLVFARMEKRFKDAKLTEDQVKAWLAKQDPSAKSGVATWEQLKTAKPEQFLALHVGLWTLPSRSASTWLMVERLVGLQEPRGMQVMPWGGLLRYENEAGDSAEITLAIDADKWVITDFALSLGRANADLGSALRREAGGPRTWTQAEKAKASEGEQLLGFARDFCRVEYSKTGSADRVTKGFNEEVGDGVFKGEYYDVNDYIKELAGSDYDAAVVAEPLEEGQPWLLMTFKWASGKSSIEWFEDRDALNERISVLTEKKE